MVSSDIHRSPANQGVEEPKMKTSCDIVCVRLAGCPVNKDTESSFLEKMPWFCQGSLGICAWISFQIQKTMIFEFSVVRFFVVLFVLTVSVTLKP